MCDKSAEYINVEEFIMDGNVLFAESVVFDDLEIKETQDIFKSWKLKDVTINVLREFGINSKDCIEALSNDNIDEMFGKVDRSFYGQRFILKQKLNEWKKEKVSFHFFFRNNLKKIIILIFCFRIFLFH